MRLDNPCPLCGRPIADTAYVCAGCVADLRARLRRAAALIDTGELDATIGRRTRTAGTGATEPKPVDRAVYAGPWCWGGGWDCGHPSCRLVWYSIAMRDVDAGGRLEDPLPHEDAGILNEGAAEVRWVVDHTARAWALFVSSQRGTPLPDRTRPAGTEPDPTPPRTAQVRWCIYGDLPFDECGCGRPHQEET